MAAYQITASAINTLTLCHLQAHARASPLRPAFCSAPCAGYRPSVSREVTGNEVICTVTLPARWKRSVTGSARLAQLARQPHEHDVIVAGFKFERAFWLVPAMLTRRRSA